MPGSGFVMVEAKFILGGLEAVLDRPAVTLNSNEGLDACSGRAPGREEGKFAVTDGAPDQQATGPQAGLRLVIFVGVKVGEFEISPVMKPRTFRALAGGKTLPGAGGDISRDFCRSARDRWLACP